MNGHHLIKSSTLKSLVREGNPCRLADGGNLFFEISRAGHTYWLMRYKSPVTAKRREVTLGRYPELGLSEARERAADWRKTIAQGLDPKVERDQEDIAKLETVDHVWDHFYAARRQRVASHRRDLSLYRREIQPKVGSTNVRDVKPLQIQDILSSIAFGKNPRPAVANDALWLIDTLFNHAIKMGLTTFNPANPFDQRDAGGKEISRHRVLSDNELHGLHAAIKTAGVSFSRTHHLAVYLLLTLGVRKMELLSAKWSAIDWETGVWELTPADTKTGHPVSIPLEPDILDVLRELKVHGCGSEFVFPAHYNGKRFGHSSPDTLNVALKKLEHGLEHFVVHDFRRTCRTKLAELGVERSIAERYINHKVDVYDL